MRGFDRHDGYMKILKVLASVVAALIALKIALEVLSIVTSLPFIVMAVAVWWFFLRDRNSTAQ